VRNAAVKQQTPQHESLSSANVVSTVVFQHPGSVLPTVTWAVADVGVSAPAKPHSPTNLCAPQDAVYRQEIRTILVSSQ
jgi:hypothetical protein